MARKSKLTSEQIDSIRNLYDAGGINYAKLAEQFGVSVLTIGKVIRKQGVYAIDRVPAGQEQVDFPEGEV